MVARAPAFLNVQPSSFSGWGLIGLNLLLEWTDDPAWFPVCLAPIDTGNLVVDGLRRTRLAPLLAESRRFQDELLQKHTGGNVELAAPVLHATGHSFGVGPAVHAVSVRGRPTVGLAVIENSFIDAEAIDAARAFTLLITASRWNEELLRAAGIDHVRNVWQGVDRTLFHPAPRSGWWRDRFVVFSGGKLEYRKSQDLVLHAFRVFARRHPESLLVTSWHSPWPQFARSLEARTWVAPVPFTASGQADVRAWVVANGVDERQFIDIGSVPNAHMPTVLREADVALFPNRAEGGTNLVAMEAMACGVPCILSRNTGHRDVMTAPGDPEPNCYPLERQTAVPDVDGGGTDGWGESDVEEAVEALEAVWRDRGEAAKRGTRGAATMAELSWPAQARRLKEAILNVVPREGRMG